MSASPASVCPACGKPLTRTRSFATHDGYILNDECQSCGWPPIVGMADKRALPAPRTSPERAIGAGSDHSQKPELVR